MKKGFIAFDIDGTLTHRLDWIDDKVVDYLGSLSGRGWEVALFTGRIYSFAKKILDRLHFPYILSVQNGADILEMPGKKPLKRNYFSGEIIPLLDEIYAGQEGDYIIYAGIDYGDFCYFRKKKHSPSMLEYLKKLEALSHEPWRDSDFNFGKEERFPLIKCFGNEKTMWKLHDELKKREGIEVSLIHDPIDRSLYLNLVTDHDASKGRAVHYLREARKPHTVIAAGDDRNDLPMLKEADIAIAIDTAPQEVLDAADIIARPPGDLGIIDAVEEAIERATHS